MNRRQLLFGAASLAVAGVVKRPAIPIAWGATSAEVGPPLFVGLDVGLGESITVLSYFPAPGELLKLEGWASWRELGDGSLLPIGHPFRLEPPTV